MEETGLYSFSKNLVELILGLFPPLPWLSARVFGELTWGDLVVAGILAAITAIVALILRTVAQRYRNNLADREDASGWAQQSIIAISKPLYALVWLFGLYIVIVPPLLKSQPAEERPDALYTAEKILDIGIFALVVWLFYRATEVLRARLLVWSRKSDSKMDDLLIPALIKTLRVVMPLLAVILGLPILGLPPAYDDVVGKISGLVLIGVVAWVLFQTVKLGESLLLAKHDILAADNLEARKIHTQVKVLSKTAYFVITLFTIASMLMVFEEVRRFGTNILASAGVVGIILGFAAQRTIANLFAGFQLAMAQPIRIDDVVIVENEWGRIEEITLTYVVIKIWDQRRLIVPLSHFIEKPFQNWTRVSSEILGSVFFYMDYSVPLEEFRKEAKRIIENHPKWDKKFWNVQVTDTTDRSVQVRILATASDSGKAWDMRCDIREQIISFLQKNHPGSLPKVRAELGNGSALAEAAIREFSRLPEKAGGS